MNNQKHGSKKELLFHYTKFDTALFHILPDQSIRLNPIGLMNDIYEQKVSLDAYIKDIDEKISIRVDFENFKNNIKIGCFVNDDEDIRGFDNQMMWNFYGENYKGICLVLDKDKLINEFKKFPRGKMEKGYVIYELVKPKQFEKDDLKTKGFSVDDLENNRMPLIQSKNTEIIWKFFKMKELISDLFFRKNKQWSNENEYRFLVFDKADQLFLDIKDSLLGVIVGPYFDIEREKNKMDFLKKIGLEKKFKVWASEYNQYKHCIIPERTEGDYFNRKIDYFKAFTTEENL